MTSALPAHPDDQVDLSLFQEQIDGVNDKYNNKRFEKGTHRITGKRTFTKLATEQQLKTAAEGGLTLANAREVAPLNIKNIMNMTTDEKRHRLSSLLGMLNKPQGLPEHPETINSAAPQHRLDEMIKADIIEKVDLEQHGPTGAFAKLFFVVENKLNENNEVIERLRAIIWPKVLNDLFAQQGYRADVNLQHISYYVDAVLDDCAFTADLKCGFHQVPLLPEARRHLRFVVNGVVYQPTRLIMGLSVSVEIMQIITEVIAGVRGTCSMHWRCRDPGGVSTAVFVDDMGKSGSERNVQAHMQQDTRRQEYAGVTFKTELTIVKNYTFLGVRFNHETKQVAVGEKTLSKLPVGGMPAFMSNQGIEQLASRLVWCSSVLNLLIPNKIYYVLKYAARRCNAMNRGIADPQALVQLPRSVRIAFDVWIDLSKQQRLVQPRRDNGRHCTIYTDASLQGGGMIMMDDHGTFFAHGWRWTDADSIPRGLDPRKLAPEHINLLEARAVAHAFNYGRDEIIKAGTINLFVDNTSVQCAIERGYAKSPELNEQITPIIREMRAHNITVNVAYIESRNNPADALSRV